MVADHVTLRCYGDLAELADADRDGIVRLLAGRARPVLDLVQSAGIPHTEVDLVLVGDRSVGWDHDVAAGERVAAYPPFTRLPAGVLSRVRPPQPRPSRFCLDAPLADLAASLRRAGADVHHDRDLDADALVATSTGQGRVLVTRDPQLLMHRDVAHGVLLRSPDPRAQVAEVLRRYPV